MLNHEINSANNEDILQLNQSETPAEIRNFNPEAAEKERAIASLDKFITDIESSDDYKPEVEYQISPDMGLAASAILKNLDKSAIDYDFETIGTKYDDMLYGFVGADEPNYDDDEDEDEDNLAEARYKKVLEALNSGSLSQDRDFAYPMAEGFTTFYVQYALNGPENTTYTADFLNDKNEPIRMTTATARLIRDNLKNDKTEKDDENQISLDDIFPVKDEHFWEKVDTWKTENDVHLIDFEDDDLNRCYLETYKKFGWNSFGLMGLCKERLLDILSEHDDHPELFEKLGLSHEQEGKLAYDLIANRVDFMAKDMLQNPEKFVDFVKKCAAKYSEVWEGPSRTPEWFVLPRYERYYYCKRLINDKGICKDYSYEDILNKIPNECKNNIETILKDMEKNFDLGGYDPTKASGFREDEEYYAWNGYLATESDHDLYPEYPLELCDKEALKKIKFYKSYDDDYEIVDGQLVFIGNK